eukprot:jgi/Chrzof1/5632/Cz16g09190.t1
MDCNGTCVPRTRTGHLLVSSSRGFFARGYVSNETNSQGAYQVTTDKTQVLYVTIPGCSPVFSVSVLNGPSAQTSFLGGIQGGTAPGTTPGDLTQGSYTFMYLGSTVETAVGSPPTVSGDYFGEDNSTSAKAIESGIWSYSAASSAASLTAQWINTNGSQPATYVMYSYQNLLALTGDVAAFSSNYGGPGGEEVTLLFIEDLP